MERKIYKGTINEVSNQIKLEAYEEKERKLLAEGVRMFFDNVESTVSPESYFDYRGELEGIRDAIKKHPTLVTDIIDSFIEKMNDKMEECGICTNCGGDVKCVETGYKNYFECESCGCIFEE